MIMRPQFKNADSVFYKDMTAIIFRSYIIKGEPFYRIWYTDKEGRSRKATVSGKDLKPRK